VSPEDSRKGKSPEDSDIQFASIITVQDQDNVVSSL
jgi:hypothetical protein